MTLLGHQPSKIIFQQMQTITITFYIKNFFISVRALSSHSGSCHPYGVFNTSLYVFYWKRLRGCCSDIYGKTWRER